MRPKAGELYIHYKGKNYKVLTIARLEDSLEEAVVYEGQYTDPQFGDHPVWIRKLSSFMESVMITREDGTTTEVPRFQKVCRNQFASAIL